MDIERIKQEVLNSESLTFYHNHLLGNEVWYYKVHISGQNYSAIYDNMKRYIATKLNIHFNDISIFGSAKIGFSLNPDKNFRNFHKGSDIDIVLVSSELFYRFWDAYLEMHSGMRYIKKYPTVTSSLFRQFICLDGFDDYSEPFIEWNKKTAGFQKDLQLLYHFNNHKVNYRIFDSWNAVQRYYVRNIEDLKKIYNKMEV